MDILLNAFKASAAAQDSAVGQPRFGLVSSVDTVHGTVRVTLQPENVLTGWLPLAAAWVGAGWGIACPPAPGDQVMVLPENGAGQPGLVVARLWSTQSPPPAAPVGEFWLVHRSGSFLKLTNDGTVQVNGNLHVSGDLHVTGDVSDRKGPLDRLRTRYDAHTHAGPKSPPDQQD